MARILNSPNQSVASEQLVLLQDALTEIKKLIISGASTDEIKKVINNFTSKFADKATRLAMERSLTQSVNKMLYQYNYNMNFVNQVFIQKVVKTYKVGSGLTQSNKSYTADLEAIYSEYLNGNISQRKVVEEFRGHITSGRYGLALVRDYDKQVMEQTKLLASEPGKYTDKNGRAISLRNKVEMSVRYAANQNDLAQYKSEGVRLVWTSSHADASPRCAPFQGMLWSLDGKSGIIDGHRYRPIEEALNENGGNSIINGYNCRHYLIEYEKGSVAPKHYTSAEIQKEYKIDQKQRQYENNIRLLKTEETLLRQQGFDKEASLYRKKWQALNKKYEQFSINNDRAYYPWRTRISQEEREKIIQVRNLNVLQKQIDDNSNIFTKPLKEVDYILYGSKVKMTQFEVDKANFYKNIQHTTSNNFAEKSIDFFKDYQKGVANENNFFLNTISFFEKMENRPNREPDYISYSKKTGKISSEYWYTKEGVIRGSNHWGSGVASCDWFLKNKEYNGLEVKDEVEYGFTKWEDFVQKTDVVKVYNEEKDKMESYLTNFDNTLGKEKYGDQLFLINNKVVDKNGTTSKDYSEYMIEKENSNALEKMTKILDDIDKNFDEKYLPQIDLLIDSKLTQFLDKYNIEYELKISKSGNEIINIPELKLQDKIENILTTKTRKKQILKYLVEKNKINL